MTSLSPDPEPASPVPLPGPDGDGPPSGGVGATASAGGEARASLVALTAAAAGGDRGAFEALHVRLSPGLRRMFSQRLGRRDDAAEDLVQRTWIAVWQALREGKYHAEKSAFTTFLYAVGFKLWLQHLRRRGRSMEASVESEAIEAWGVAATPDPGDAGHLSDVLSAVRACMRGEGAGALDEHERSLLSATASGVSDRELAKRLGVAPSTLNVRKQTAMAKLRRYLAVRGFRDSDSAERLPRTGE